MSEFYNATEAGLLESIELIGEEFIWQENTYSCIIDQQHHSVITAKSFFDSGRYPQWGQLITVEGKVRQITKLNGSAVVTSGGGMVEDPPFTDDPANPRSRRSGGRSSPTSATTTLEFDLLIRR